MSDAHENEHDEHERDEHEHHEHEHHGPEYEHPDGEVHPHIGDWKFYVGIFFALIVLTILTVGVASIHLGPANLAVAVIIASLKASLVCAFFMHLSTDTRFHGLIMICTVMFIGVFFAYTINDTGHRGMIDVDSQSGAKVHFASGDKAPGSWERPVIGGGEKQEGEKKDDKKPEH